MGQSTCDVDYALAALCSQKYKERIFRYCLSHRNSLARLVLYSSDLLAAHVGFDSGLNVFCLQSMCVAEYVHDVGDDFVLCDRLNY